MGSIDVINRPLTRAELTARYEELLSDPRYSSVQGRFELTAWGQIMMTPPADVWHYRVAARLARSLMASLGGEAFQEGAVAVEGGGTPVADVVWCSAQFLLAHGNERILQRAPEICVEVLSKSNSTKEIDDKRRAYFAAGAAEVWIVDPAAETINVYGQDGLREKSVYQVGLSGLFAP